MLGREPHSALAVRRIYTADVEPERELGQTETPLHLAPDRQRDQWLSDLTSFVEAAIKRPVAPAHAV